MDSETVSGGYGFIAIPDRATIERAYQLAARIFPRDSEYVLSPAHLPHLTLYHSKMKEVPLTWADEVCQEIQTSLAEVRLHLHSIICFGGKFIFWNVDPADKSYSLLKSAHERALLLAQYLDRAAVRRADEEGLTLSAKEKENVDQFNHPLVGDLYMPHITLGYDERSEKLIGGEMFETWAVQIESVRFAEIGHPGVVKRLC